MHCAIAAPSVCPGFFVGGLAPDVSAPIAVRGYVLCYESYSVAESGVTRTALWSAEHLTRDSVAAARDTPRVDAFHSDQSLPPSDRAERIDYQRSGWDEGHMSPSGDAPNPRAQFETFALSNMAPQNPDNNRFLWQGIEIATRSIARYQGEVYVVTGPAFVGPRTVLGGRVQVPSHVWKAIYEPGRGAAAYMTRNAPGDAYAVISIVALTHVIGIDPFPALSMSTKQHAMHLPPPRPNGQKLERGPVDLVTLGLGSPEQISTINAPQIAPREGAGQYALRAISNVFSTIGARR